MAASSVGTYLDITQAARGAAGTATEPATSDPEFTARAAKVLATIHAGTGVVAELPAKTDLDTEQVLDITAWLSRAGLVTLDEQDGALRARLTDPAEAALSSG
jgi:hypothetical protein